MGSIETSDIEDLFQTHGPTVYRRALRLLGNAADAEEATQEVFIRALISRDGFRAESLPTTWLYRITTNYCLKQIRSRRVRAHAHERRLVPSHAEPNGENVVLWKQLTRVTDERQARAAVYVYLDGCSYAEAAECLGVSVRTVGYLLERFQTWAQAESALDRVA